MDSKQSYRNHKGGLIMALKTNSKAVKDKIKQYICDSFHNSDFEEWNKVQITDYSEICYTILHEFYIEKIHLDFQKGRRPYQDYFIKWCGGLPSILDTCYYYNVSAVDLLGDWLEQTEKERNKYSESQAEELITKLLYRELTNHCSKKWDFSEGV